MRSDEEAYAGFLSGDVSAYDDLLARHGDNLVLYLYGYLRNWQDAEDMMIEAFARIIVKKPTIRRGSFKAYLFKTARNLASRFHTVRRRAEAFSLDDAEAELAGSTLWEQKLLDAERSRILHLCLGRIDPELREALWLVYFEEMSYRDAAGVMGCGVKRIDRLLQRGKTQLRRELEKEGITHAHD